jgi:hypothetical protein
MQSMCKLLVKISDWKECRRHCLKTRVLPSARTRPSGCQNCPTHSPVTTPSLSPVSTTPISPFRSQFQISFSLTHAHRYCRLPPDETLTLATLSAHVGLRSIPVARGRGRGRSAGGGAGAWELSVSGGEHRPALPPISVAAAWFLILVSFCRWARSCCRWGRRSRWGSHP